MARNEKLQPWRQLEMADGSPENLCVKQKKDGEKCGTHTALLTFCLMTFPFFVFLFGSHRFDSTLIWQSDAKVTVKELRHDSSNNSVPPNNNNLDGLISPNFNKQSCLSRYEAALYRKVFPYMPSSYLLHKLRNYEALHKKCGPHTSLYWKSIQQLNLGHSLELMDCNYVVWIPYNGLGNRILSLLSTFLYAILTNRVLLIQPTDDSVDLFCEPFPDTSWILPDDFPLKNLTKLNAFSSVTYGNMLDKHVISNDPKTKVDSLPSYVYVHLEHDYHHLDRLFFCNDDQIVLGKVNWLLLQSDLYFVPSLFSTSLFEEELGWLFPAKESVFYLLSHYLIHPSNLVWGMVKRYYISYLAKADEVIGIQIRTFSWSEVSSDVIFQRILNCSQMQHILPEIDLNGAKVLVTNKPKSKAILLASLQEDYYTNLQSMYYEHSVNTGEFVSVYQPSHEGKQSTENHSHNQKALAEIYLLSLCDVLLTSGWSTFGYVSHGLAGIKPIFLHTIGRQNLPDQPCIRAISMEPCMHAPPKINCRGKTIDKEKLQQYVKQCEDVNEGIKLFD